MLRPGYGCDELLLEFNAQHSADALEQELFFILENNGFKFEAVEDLWMNDELLFKFKSTNGALELSRDNWDFIFILGEKKSSRYFKAGCLTGSEPTVRKDGRRFFEVQMI